jgi:protoheme IX farnesyltransferase
MSESAPIQSLEKIEPALNAAIGGIGAPAPIVFPRPFTAVGRDCLELLKPRVTALVMITAWAACNIAGRGAESWLRDLNLVIGTGLVAGGTAALNQWWEWRTDALMRRTAARPLPAGRLHPLPALRLGLVLIAVGLVYFGLTINLLTEALALATAGLYLLAYTPLKRRTHLSTIVGAFPGAGPILMGWAAATGGLSEGAWVLFAIQFLWQFPHFLSIAWLYREDYRRAGICMLPVVDEAGHRTGLQIVLYSLALIPVSLLPAVIGLTSTMYVIGATVLGLGLLTASVYTARSRSNRSARRLLQATVLYLPLLFVLMLVARP